MSPLAQATTSITTPIEVSDGSIGAPPSTLPVTSCHKPISISFALDANALANATYLYLQVHGIKYSREASIQINGNLSTKTPWVSLMNPDETATAQTLATYSPTNPNLQVIGSGGYYGGIGGSFTVLKLLINLKDGQTFGKRTGTPFQVGTNQLTFCYNGTDGRVSGYRVIDVNLLSTAQVGVVDSSGKPILTTTLDNPENWKSPTHANGSAASASNGASLWANAALKSSKLSNATAIHAKCLDCHTQTGSDLYYFNYSNATIIERSIYHGLSADQGADIAAFIRTLPNLTNPGRPWNPPFQPGNGLDSLPVASWSAGAGVSSVLDNDRAAFSSLGNWGRNADAYKDSVSRTIVPYMSVRNFPVALQFPDWNEWLPIVHPLDALNISNPSQSASYNNFLNGTASVAGFNGSEVIKKKLGHAHCELPLFRLGERHW